MQEAGEEAICRGKRQMHTALAQESLEAFRGASSIHIGGHVANLVVRCRFGFSFAATDFFELSLPGSARRG
jgi:hypothetical protein